MHSQCSTPTQPAHTAPRRHCTAQNAHDTESCDLMTLLPFFYRNTMISLFETDEAYMQQNAHTGTAAQHTRDIQAVRQQPQSSSQSTLGHVSKNVSLDSALRPRNLTPSHIDVTFDQSDHSVREASGTFWQKTPGYRTNLSANSASSYSGTSSPGFRRTGPPRSDVAIKHSLVS